MNNFTIGRTLDNKYTINSPIIDDQHLSVSSLSPSEYIIRDISKKFPNKLLINRQIVKLARIDRFTPLTIGNIRFNLGMLFNGEINEMMNIAEQSDNNQLKDYPLEINKTYLLGASHECDIVLPSPKVNWKALKINVNDDDQYTIRFVHGRKKLSLFSGDSLQIGSYILNFKDNAVLNISLIAKGEMILNNIEVINPFNKNHRLIKSLSLSIAAGEFIGIIGPSGAGKSTLLKAIRLMLPIENGNISLSGKNIFQHPDLLKEIGFVPQDDVVITELTVKENLQYAASLRLPSDWPKEGHEERVNQLLENMRLKEQQDNLASKISGGQRKRLNLALELLMEPAFLLADEVCSGLSALDTDNILQHLRRLRDQGMAIVLTIHSPDIEAFDLMDNLLVLDQGGIIAYYGPTHEAIPYFSTAIGRDSPHQSPKLIFDILEKTKSVTSDERKVSPEKWGQIYKMSMFYRHHIEAKILKDEDTL